MSATPCYSPDYAFLESKFNKLSKKISVVPRDETGKGQNSTNTSREKVENFQKIF